MMGLLQFALGQRVFLCLATFLQSAVFGIFVFSCLFIIQSGFYIFLGGLWE
jgi:hypothetical protein